MNDLAARVDAAVSAVCPIVGVIVNTDNTVTVQYDPSATTQQRAAASSALAALDMRPRQQRTLAAIKADLDTLTNAQLLNALKLLLAREVRDDPRLLQRLGVNIVGDEVAATP